MSRVPKLLPGQRLTSLQLTPGETFLLSRIDGMVDEHDLALISGLSPPQVSALLERLVGAGAAEFVRPSQVPAERPLYDPAELDEAVELEPERRRRVLELFYRIEDLTYYELLDVAENADKKQIKSAYYVLAPEFHPDKYFRKNLGSYKQKIEAIFAKITLAHDVLTGKKREEYDDYLKLTHRNRSVAASLEQTPREVAAVAAAVAAAAAATVSAQPQPGYDGAASGPKSRAPSEPSQPQARAPTPAEPVRTLSPEETLRQRREALARKLTGGQRRPTPAPAPRGAPAEMDPAVAQRVAEAMRLRHEAAVAEAKKAQLSRYLEQGKAALQGGDFAGAANSYRIAASLAPDDLAVQATCTEALRQAAAALAEGYWKQALYEEEHERWAEAALSYSKVCAGRPDSPQAHERVAYTTLMSSTNARRAVEFGRRAVELSPNKPEYRITLSRAYAAAGLEKSAKGELDRALELAPTDAKIQALVAQARAATPKEGKVG
jgi:curved DNA-binding protein CbpA